MDVSAVLEPLERRGRRPVARRPAPRAPAGPLLARAALACAVLPALTAAAGQERPELPPSPAARAWATVARGTLPATGAPGGVSEAAFASWPAAGAQAWDEPAPWRRWTALLRALLEDDGRASSPGAGERAPAPGEGPQPASELRASLALCALAQGRFDDAWTHFAAVARRPRAGAAPALFPARRSRRPPGPRGRRARAAGGGRAPRSALPPEAEAASVFGAREMRSAPFVVGDATLAMRVYYEPGDGVQVDLEHLGGGPAELSVRLPHPLDFALGKQYRDWDEVESVEGAVAVRLSAEQAEVSLWANHVGLPPSFPRRCPPTCRRASGARAYAWPRTLRRGCGASPRRWRSSAGCRWPRVRTARARRAPRAGAPPPPTPPSSARSPPWSWARERAALGRAGLGPRTLPAAAPAAGHRRRAARARGSRRSPRKTQPTALGH